MTCVTVSIAVALTGLLFLTSASNASRDDGQSESGRNATGKDWSRFNRYDDSNFNDPSNASLYISYPTALSRRDGTGNETRGRALDLEALFGEPSQDRDTGDRESRIINEKPNLGISGFIPIITLDQHHKRKDGPSQQNNPGHQSFLPHEPYQNNQFGHQNQPQEHFQEEPKFIGGALHGLASVLKPKRKYGSEGGVIGQDCLCVPFYMCKNGFLESTGKNSIGGGGYPSKEQIEQQFAAAESEASKNFAGVPPQLSSFYQQTQQQQQQQNQHHQQHLQQQQPQQQPQQQSGPYHSAASQDSPQYDANLPLDERSVDGSGSGERSAHFPSNSNSSEGAPQYVSDVLARMLGPGPQSCGVLRTCCRIAPEAGHFGQNQPFNLPQGSEVFSQPIQSHFQPGHNPFQGGPHPNNPFQGFGPKPHNQPHSPTNLPFLRPPFRKHQHQLGTFEVLGASLFKPKPFQQQGQRPFGPFVTPLPGFLGGHNVYNPSKPYGKPPPHGFPGQFGPHGPRPIHGGQPVHPLFGSRPPRPVNIIQQLPPQHIQPHPSSPFAVHSAPSQNLGHGGPSPLYGSCGARNGVGIHGRVQNLNYHESSTEFGEYPWQVALLKRIGPADSLYVCGATMLTSEWVLTAAHCIKKNTAADLKVRFGEWDVHREDEFYPHVERFVHEIIIHPEFFPGNLVNDIALIRIDSPVDLNNPHISPICLPEPYDNFAGHRCWVTGWGKNAFGHQGEYQSVLKEVDLPVVNNGQCEHALRNTRLGPHYQLHPGFMCAGGEPGKDACEGDGGSPLVCDVNGVWKVAGLVSWGIGCGQPGVPGVYASVPFYRQWIDSVISRFGPGPYAHGIISERSNSLGNDTLVRESRSEAVFKATPLPSNSTETTTTSTTSYLL